MAVRGCFGRVTVGGSVLAEVRSWEYEEASEEQDATVMGDCTKTYVAGPVETTVRLSMFAKHLPGTDPAQDTAQAALVTGASVTLVIQPNGQGTGKPQLSGALVVTRLRSSSSAAGLWEAEVEGRLSGSWTTTQQ